MKAAVLHELGKPLAIEEVARPKPEANEVLLEVEACGVCHSDLHIADGAWRQFARITKKPLILGHEIVGRVVETGAEVREWNIGDRAGVPWIHWTCGECEFCREGNENLCPSQKITGVTVDGGYAEFVKAPASHVTKIPDGLSSVEAAPLLCAGVTVQRAIRRAEITRGQRVAIFGVGGLGHLAVQIAASLGVEITAVDVSEERLALAKSLGAQSTLNAASTNVIEQLRRQGGVDVALVTAAAAAAYNTAFVCVRPSGMLLVVGLPADEICFSPILMAAKEIRIQASAVGTRQDLRQILELAAQDKIRPQVSTRPLDQVNEVLNALRAGQISGRVVLTPSSSAYAQ